MEKNYYTGYSCCGFNEESNDYVQYVSDTEYTEIVREQERESLEKELVTN